MSIQDYYPTGREWEVLQFIKEEPDQRTTGTEISRTMGISKDVIDDTLKNLETVGCVRRRGADEYEFYDDPAGL